MITRLKIPALLSTLLIVIALVPSLVQAQCSTSVDNQAADGTAVFGLRWDGVRINCGQSITLACDSRLLSAGFRMQSAPSGEYNGVPYVNMGDLLSVDIVDQSFNIVATGTAAVSHSTGFDWVTVDFTTQNVNLPAGDYLIGAYITADKISFINYTPTDVIDGQRHWYAPGSWGNATGGDAVIQATWEEHLVATDTADWGEIKSMYR